MESWSSLSFAPPAAALLLYSVMTFEQKFHVQERAAGLGSKLELGVQRLGQQAEEKLHVTERARIAQQRFQNIAHRLMGNAVVAKGVDAVKKGAHVVERAVVSAGQESVRIVSSAQVMAQSKAPAPATAPVTAAAPEANESETAELLKEEVIATAPEAPAAAPAAPAPVAPPPPPPPPPPAAPGFSS